MEWTELLFAHWRVEPDRVRPLLPAGLRLDVRDDAAWVGVIPFAMEIRPRGVPPLGPLTSFLETNVRTYVTKEGRPGVWFFSLDAERRLAVLGGRRLFHLPYFHASMSLRGRENEILYESRRRGPDGATPAELRVAYAPSGELPEAEGVLGRWLTERYCLYAADDEGGLYRTEVDHAPWPLRRATVRVDRNTLGEAAGLPLRGPPDHVLYSERLRVVAWTPDRVG